MTDAMKALTGGKYATSVKRTEAKQLGSRLIPDGGQAQLVQVFQDGGELLG